MSIFVIIHRAKRIYASYSALVLMFSLSRAFLSNTMATTVQPCYASLEIPGLLIANSQFLDTIRIMGHYLVQLSLSSVHDILLLGVAQMCSTLIRFEFILLWVKNRNHRFKKWKTFIMNVQLVIITTVMEEKETQHFDNFFNMIKLILHYSPNLQSLYLFNGPTHESTVVNFGRLLDASSHKLQQLICYADEVEENDFDWEGEDGPAGLREFTFYCGQYHPGPDISNIRHLMKRVENALTVLNIQQHQRTHYSLTLNNIIRYSNVPHLSNNTRHTISTILMFPFLINQGLIDRLRQLRIEKLKLGGDVLENNNNVNEERMQNNNNLKLCIRQCVAATDTGVKYARYRLGKHNVHLSK
ncbi:hypothetical protein BDA99DRAFT_544223 [Phascolomyces articulosus]|uniref:Uncharacterized protein n=1 Tax=Phascolomyces articulosus TaxID=60185 RepID=A0AAD5P701_9FUNG|nr:hypothetical protein BDA99DRAFT_544223 [Phascolomyces articulosus]